MSITKTNFDDLIAMTTLGQAIEAIEKHFADDAQIIQGDGRVWHNKAEIITGEQEFFGGVERLDKFEITESVVSGDTSFDISIMKGLHTQMGEFDFKQASMMHWKDGKVIKVQFYPEM